MKTGFYVFLCVVLPFFLLSIFLLLGPKLLQGDIHIDETEQNVFALSRITEEEDAVNTKFVSPCLRDSSSPSFLYTKNGEPVWMKIDRKYQEKQVFSTEDIKKQLQKHVRKEVPFSVLSTPSCHMVNGEYSYQLPFFQMKVPVSFSVEEKENMPIFSEVPFTSDLVSNTTHVQDPEYAKQTVLQYQNVKLVLSKRYVDVYQSAAGTTKNWLFHDQFMKHISRVLGVNQEELSYAYQKGDAFFSILTKSETYKIIPFGKNEQFFFYIQKATK